jgi:hypothetical protein
MRRATAWALSYAAGHRPCWHECCEIRVQVKCPVLDAGPPYVPVSDPDGTVLAMGRMALYDRAAVEDLLHKQYGLITRRQEIDRGLTDAALHHRLRRGGTWQVLLPGVYLSSTGMATGPQCVIAAQLYAGPDSVITGAAAPAAHGVRRPEGSDVDVLVPVARKCRSVRFVRVHRRRRMPVAVQRVGPIRYAPVAPLSPGDWERTMATHSRMSVRGIIVLHYNPRRLRTERLVVAAEIRAAVAGGRPLPVVRTMAPATSVS